MNTPGNNVPFSATPKGVEANLAATTFGVKQSLFTCSVGVVSLNPRLIALIPAGCLVAFTEECLKRGQFDSQKTFENSTEQAFVHGVRAGGDDGFKKRLKTVPSDLQKSDFGSAASELHLTTPHLAEKSFRRQRKPFLNCSNRAIPTGRLTP